MPKAFDRAVLERELGIVTYQLHALGDAESPETDELNLRHQGLLDLLDSLADQA